MTNLRRKHFFPSFKLLVRKESLLFLLCAAAFLLGKYFNISPRVSDENLYFYGAHLIHLGILPYRDFFFQHLPTQIVIFAWLIRWFGFHLQILKSVHLISSIGTAFILFQLVNQRGSRNGGILAALLFLSSYVVLGTTDYALGVHEATFFLIFFWYLTSRRPVAAGLALFFGLSYRLYILPAALGIMLFELMKKRGRAVLRCLLAFGLPFLVLNLVLYSAFGDHFLTPVWRYHLLKLSVESMQDEFPLFIRNDVLLMLFSTGTIWILFQKSRNALKSRFDFGRLPSASQLGLSATAALAAQVVFLLILSRVFQYYFVNLIPFLSVLTAIGLSSFLPVVSRKYALPLVLVLVLFNGYFYAADIAQMSKVDQIDALVSDIDSLTPNHETIFGSYVITPLLALLTNREISDYEVDTNFQRNLTGLFTTQDATRIATGSAVFIQKSSIDYETGEIMSLEPFYVDRRTVLKSCRLYRDYRQDRGLTYNALIVWDCRK